MNVLQVEKVTKNYGDKTAVNQIELKLGEGEIFGLLGANGAGKTTTMRMVLGLIYPDSGRILWKGKGYSDELRRIMGYCRRNAGCIRRSRFVTRLCIWRS